MTTPPASRVPPVRLRPANQRPVQRKGRYVVYWMIAARRRRSNYALQRAVEWCRHLGQPLLVLEALRSDYPWASPRLHAFVIDGMAHNLADFRVPGVRYYPYVESAPAAGRGLLHALAAHASVVVTDDFPCFFLPRMVEAAGRKISCRLEAVDTNGIVPLRATDKAFPTAYAFRRYLHGAMADHLEDQPARDPLQRIPLPPFTRIPAGIRGRWPDASRQLAGLRAALARRAAGDAVAPAPFVGGARAARKALRRFVRQKLEVYPDHRNVPDAFDATSGLSPYLHFGHIAAHDVFEAVVRRDGWNPGRIGRERGSRHAWGLSEPGGAFVDQLVTWRELGYNACAHLPDYDHYASLPSWARDTLAAHARDRREHIYTVEEFDRAETHDALWNAAQRQLRSEGRCHNYLRMLWGKKILEWTRSPEEALDVMVELNNRYALDGRNPNSYSGIFWVLGRYDRPWGPERAVFGKVRYMSSANTARKFSVTGYRARFGPGEA